MEDKDKDDDNNKDNNNDKGISALGLDINIGFSGGNQGHQGYQPHDDDESSKLLVVIIYCPRAELPL